MRGRQKSNIPRQKSGRRSPTDRSQRGFSCGWWLILCWTIFTAVVWTTDKTVAADRAYLDCGLGRRDPDRSISGCTLYIGASKRDIGRRARAFYYRGMAHHEKNYPEGATADLRHPI